MTADFLAAIAKASRAIPTGDYVIRFVPGTLSVLEKLGEDNTPRERGANAVLLIAEGEFAGREIAYTFKDTSNYRAKQEADRLVLIALAKICEVTKAGGSLGLLQAVAQRLHPCGSNPNNLRIVFRLTVGADNMGRPEYSLSNPRLLTTPAKEDQPPEQKQKPKAAAKAKPAPEPQPENQFDASDDQFDASELEDDAEEEEGEDDIF